MVEVMDEALIALTHANAELNLFGLFLHGFAPTHVVSSSTMVPA